MAIASVDDYQGSHTCEHSNRIKSVIKEVGMCNRHQIGWESVERSIKKLIKEPFKLLSGKNCGEGE